MAHSHRTTCSTRTPKTRAVNRVWEPLIVLQPPLAIARASARARVRYGERRHVPVHARQEGRQQRRGVFVHGRVRGCRVEFEAFPQAAVEEREDIVAPPEPERELRILILDRKRARTEILKL